MSAVDPLRELLVLTFASDDTSGHHDVSRDCGCDRMRRFAPKPPRLRLINHNRIPRLMNDFGCFAFLDRLWRLCLPVWPRIWLHPGGFFFVALPSFQQ